MLYHLVTEFNQLTNAYRIIDGAREELLKFGSLIVEDIYSDSQSKEKAANKLKEIVAIVRPITLLDPFANDVIIKYFPNTEASDLASLRSKSFKRVWEQAKECCAEIARFSAFDNLKKVKIFVKIINSYLKSNIHFTAQYFLEGVHKLLYSELIN